MSDKTKWTVEFRYIDNDQTYLGHFKLSPDEVKDVRKRLTWLIWKSKIRSVCGQQPNNINSIFFAYSEPVFHSYDEFEITSQGDRKSA